MHLNIWIIKIVINFVNNGFLKLFITFSKKRTMLGLNFYYK